MAQKRFDGRFDYLANEEVQVNKEYEAFTRTDYKNWSKTEFILVGVFLVPFRLVLMIGYLILVISTIKIVYFVCRVKDIHRLSQPLYKFTRILVSIWAKIFMFGFGIQYQEELREIDDSKYSKIERAQVKNQNETIIVSNHVCFFDFFPFFAYYNACTIAKNMVKNIPLISFGAKVAQTIFVKRDKNQSRKDAMEKLRKRIELNKQNITPSQILIFPEATVSNGDYLLQFKKGAFVNGLPITVCAVKYESNFDPSMNLVSFVDGIIGLLFQYKMKMKMFRIKNSFVPKKDTSIEDFMEEIRTMMADEIGFKKSHNKFPDNLVFESKYLEL